MAASINLTPPLGLAGHGVGAPARPHYSGQLVESRSVVATRKSERVHFQAACGQRTQPRRARGNTLHGSACHAWGSA